MINFFSGRKPGVVNYFLIVGIFIILAVVALVVFGPANIGGLGQLGSRQEGQQSFAVTGDSWDKDGDGFSDRLEEKIGVDPAAACPSDLGHLAWPPDVNNDRKVDMSDILAYTNRINTSVGEANYSARYDLNGDGSINITDILSVKSYYGKSCTS